MAKFTKGNNPNKKKHRRICSRTDADIIASKNMCCDRCNGVELPPSYYEAYSDRLSRQPSRNIFREDLEHE